MNRRMDMSGMGGMGGMDMGSGNLFRTVDMKVARGYWAAIAGVVALLACIRIISILQSRNRQSAFRKAPKSVPSRPQGVISQAYATATAICREMSYSQPVHFSGRITKYFSPLPVGQWLILALYWSMLLAFLWTGTILEKDDPMYPYKWEKVGFRAAWVSVSQIPFIYLLSCKFNPISMLTGISYERFNWLHRWAARTVFLTLIVHWSFFFTEWTLADIVQLELNMMTMVKYGFGAWGVIGWMVLSSFGFFRHMNYELFVAQHICAAAVLLWLIFLHVPAYARYNVYMAIGFVSFDWGARIIWNVLRNTHLLGRPSGWAPGYSARLETLPGDMVRVTIDDTDVSWRAGQHAFLSMPALRPLELHPFTIANAPVGGPGRCLTMVIKAHSGFSKSLHSTAMKNTEPTQTYRAFLSGPWGSPPDLLHYETVVLVACSSGASFTTPLVEELARKQGCVRRVIFHWIIRDIDHFQWFGKTLEKLVEHAHESKFSLQVVVHVTKPVRPDMTVAARSGSDATSTQKKMTTDTDVTSVGEGSISGTSIASMEDEKSPLTPIPQHRPAAILLTKFEGRPTVESLIRSPVETALGETAVVVCGGISITAEVRTFVAALSDERAVHKGTNAQGIYLFVETFG